MDFWNAVVDLFLIFSLCPSVLMHALYEACSQQTLQI